MKYTFTRNRKSRITLRTPDWTNSLHSPEALRATNNGHLRFRTAILREKKNIFHSIEKDLNIDGHNNAYAIRSVEISADSRNSARTAIPAFR